MPPRAAVVGSCLLAAAALACVAHSRGEPAQPLAGVGAAVPLAVEMRASPMALAARYVPLDISGMRWLWWPAILYLFWGMAYICDVYFVRTIDVISERFKIPDDVAGATLMALGCNGPEMALNTIAIFHPSSIGVGAVIGGEVFNVLVIIGAALLATPDAYLPLRLSPFTFFRDVLFYVASVGILYWVLRDGNITRVDSLVLLLGAVLYTATVAFSSKLSGLLMRMRPRRAARRLSRRLSHRLSPQPTPVAAERKDTEDTEDEASGADREMVAHWLQARHCADPSDGSVLSVRVDVRNRLMDRSHHYEERYVWFRGDALLVSTAMDPIKERLAHTESSELVYDHDVHAHEQHWHYGGLVHKPVFLGGDLEASSFKPEAPSFVSAGELESGTPLSKAFSATPISQLTRPLLNETSKFRAPSAQRSPPPADLPGFRDAPWEIIPLEDVLYCEHQGDSKHFVLHVHQRDAGLGSLLTLEFGAQRPAVLDSWTVALSEGLMEQRRRTSDAPPAQSCASLLMEWAEWVQFPVRFAMSLTIPDMDDPKQQHWYPVSFLMSMAWLAVFAYSVVAACDGIHEDFGISVTLLGFTVAAAGTSFPNVISGMVVARKGKATMAVANALGANVQNVFLALAVPWVVQTWFISHGPFPMVVPGLLPAIVECLVTLLPVVLVFLCCGATMPRWSGALFLLTYAVYLVFALGQQTTGCVLWPLPCRPTGAAA